LKLDNWGNAMLQGRHSDTSLKQAVMR